jgi:hypothetical protein
LTLSNNQLSGGSGTIVGERCRRGSST